MAANDPFDPIGNAASFGRRLRAFRESSGWKQDEVSAKCGIPQSVISDMENDRYKNPSADQVIKLAELFSTTPRYLMTGKGDRRAVTILTDEERQLLQAFRSLDDRDRSILSGTARTLVDPTGGSPTPSAPKARTE